MSERENFWKGLSCLTVLGLCAGAASRGLAGDGSIAVSISAPVNQYIAVPKQLPEGLPSPAAQGTVTAALTEPSLQQEERIVRTVFVWFVESVKMVDGTNLNGTAWTQGNLGADLYNSNENDAANRIIESKNSLSTNVRLGLKETGHVQVTVVAGAQWDITGGDQPRNPSTFSAPLVIDFYGVQAKILAVPRAIAANATGYVPVCFRILGPSTDPNPSGQWTGALIRKVSFVLAPCSELVSPVEYETVWQFGAPVGLVPGDQVTQDPGPTDDWKNYQNGQTNTYTLLVPPAVFHDIELETTDSYRSDNSELWLNIDLTVTKPGETAGSIQWVVDGPALPTGMVYKHEKDGQTVPGVVILDKSIPVMELGLNNEGAPMDAFSPWQTRGHVVPTPALTKYDSGSSSWAAPGFDTSFVADPNDYAFARCLLESDGSNASYSARVDLDTDGWDQSAGGDRWRLVEPNREQGALFLVYYGKKNVSDLSGIEYNVRTNSESGVRITGDGGVVDVRMKHESMNASLFYESIVMLSIGGDVQESQLSATLTGVSNACSLATGVCAVIAAGGGPSAPAWATAAGSWQTLSGLTGLAAQWAQPGADDASARAECFGGLTIQKADGTSPTEGGQPAAYVAPTPATDRLQGHDHSANTVKAVSDHDAGQYSKQVSGEVQVEANARALSTWKVFSSGTATAYVKEPAIGSNQARAYVYWSASGSPTARSRRLAYKIGATSEGPSQPDDTVSED